MTPTDEGRVRFHHPDEDDQVHECPLVDISVAGLSFALDRKIPGIERGCKIRNVRLSIRGIQFHGLLLVMSVMPYQRRPDHVGAVFYPSTESDLELLNRAIVSLDSD